MQKKLCGIFYFFSIFIFFSCSTLNIQQTQNENFTNFDELKNLTEEDFSPICEFAKIKNFYLTNEKTICHLVKIDFQNQNLKINFFPDENFNKQESLENNSTKIKSKKQKLQSSQSISAAQFSKNTNSKVAINTTQFSQKIKYFSKQKIIGIYQIGKNKISNQNEKYAALAFYWENQNSTLKNSEKKLRAKIIDFQTNENLDFLNSSQIEIIAIIGGYWQILRDEKIIHFKEILDSRTAIGISADEKSFYILSVEGENKNQSKGLSYSQCARIFKNIGCKNAMQFDGGDSATLFINGINAQSYPRTRKLPAWLGFSLAE